MQLSTLKINLSFQRIMFPCVFETNVFVTAKCIHVSAEKLSRSQFVFRFTEFKIRGVTYEPHFEIKLSNLWKYLWLHHLSGKMSLVSADLVILPPGHGS